MYNYMDFSDLEALHSAFSNDVDKIGDNVEQMAHDIDLLGITQDISHVIESTLEPIEQPNENKPKKKASRCNHTDCNKKLGLMPFNCKCGRNFCARHRHIDTHECTYDHKSDERRRLGETLPQIVADKLENRI